MLNLPGASATSTCHEGSPNRCSSRTFLATAVCRFGVNWAPCFNVRKACDHPQEYLRLIRISTLLSQPKFTEQLHARIKELLRETLRLVNLITAPASLRVQRIRAFHNTHKESGAKGYNAITTFTCCSRKPTSNAGITTCRPALCLPDSVHQWTWAIGSCKILASKLAVDEVIR